MIRCRNFRRLSSQSDECYRTRGRRDSSTQIIDGTLATMAVETSSTLFDSSTQTGKTIFSLFFYNTIKSDSTWLFPKRRTRWLYLGYRGRVGRGDVPWRMVRTRIFDCHTISLSLVKKLTCTNLPSHQQTVLNTSFLVIISK